MRSSPRRRALGLCLGVATTTALVLASGSLAQAAPTGTVMNAGGPDTVPGLYIVGLHGGTSLAPSAASTVSAEAGGLAGRYGGTVRNVYSAALRGFAVKMSEQQAKRLAADPKVDFVQQSLWVRSASLEGTEVAGEQPNPTWGLDQIDGANDGVYKYPNTGTGVTVYNTDTELNLDHVSFEGRAKSGYDFVDEDPNVNDCKNQFDQGHGTHTGGTSSSETYGVAKDVAIYGVKTLDCTGNAPDADSIQGIDWVTQNAKSPAVANASWTSGGAGADPEGIMRAIRNSISTKKVTWVAAAGNENQDACNVVPAKMPEVITVAATQDEQNNEAGYSNHGSCVDIYAPGSNITSASNYQNNGTKNMQGTSMAAPHVTGAVALYLSAHPGADPATVEQAIEDNAKTGWVRNPGPGSPNRFLDVTNLGGGGNPSDPTAAFTANCSTTANDCTFDAAASRGTITSYSWKFGDSQTGTGVNPSHTYGQAGTYSVELTVTDNAGKTDTETKQVTVGRPPAGQPPRASFTVQCQWAACSFNGSGSSDPDNDIASYAWTYGDGQTGTGVTSAHSYPNAQRTYTAQLKVTDRAGASNTASRQIQCWSFGSQAFCFGQ